VGDGPGCGLIGWEVGSRGVGEFGWECGEGRMTSATGDFTES